mmetsp:Transcript_114182/g.357057  ORF Transcript_114182/g.357057 Transcript_114182/m.357057 type:complete len:229 (+) Transcript_114182:514-1200(+)
MNYRLPPRAVASLPAAAPARASWRSQPLLEATAPALRAHVPSASPSPQPGVHPASPAPPGPEPRQPPSNPRARAPGRPPAAALVRGARRGALQRCRDAPRRPSGAPCRSGGAPRCLRDAPRRPSGAPRRLSGDPRRPGAPRRGAPGGAPRTCGCGGPGAPQHYAPETQAAGPRHVQQLLHPARRRPQCPPSPRRSRRAHTRRSEGAAAVCLRRFPNSRGLCPSSSGQS